MIYSPTLHDMLFLAVCIIAAGALVASFALTYEWLSEIFDDEKGEDDGRANR